MSPLRPRNDRDAVDADVAAGVHDGPDHVVGLGADVAVHFDGAAVAGDHRLGRGLGGFQARPPAGMGDVDDDADAVHFRDGRAAEVADARVGRLGAAVAEHVAAVVGEVHHADAELKEEPDGGQLTGGRVPLLGERDAVAREIQAVPLLALGRFDVGGQSRLATRGRAGRR